jgi:hypothetical protein
MRIMAGVLAILRSHKRVMHCDPKALELEAAKEILAEVFRVNIPDVDGMIQNRFDQPTPEMMAMKKMDSGRGSFGWMLNRAGLVH